MPSGCSGAGLCRKAGHEPGGFGIAFQIDATTSKPTATYVVRSEWSQNFPPRTPKAAMMPIKKGEKPRRLDPPRARAATATARNPIVMASR